MDFGWIKKLFKIKSSTNGSDVGISTIDTSFIKVPKLSDLSKDNQDKVMEYFNEIKYENYETIVKYSDSLLEKSNKEIDFFVHDMEYSIKNISIILKEVNEENYFKLLLYREEIKLSIEELNKIEEEAELRLIALDTYIKKEERRKYDFLGIFGKAERLRYLSDKSSLLNERQRLLITIKLNKQHLQIIYNTLNENKDLLKTMNSYFKSQSSNMVCCNYETCEKHAEKLLKRKILICKDECKELKDLVELCEDIWGIYRGLCLSYVSPEKLKELELSLGYKKIIPFLARESRIVKQYAYEHRNDYKEFINEMNAFANHYANSPSNRWDLKKLNYNIIDFQERINKYGYLCEKYLSDNVINEIIDSLLNLGFYQYITSGSLLSDKRLKPGIPVPPPPCKEKVNVFSIKFDIRDKMDKKREIEYYDKLSLDLLKRIEDKYNVSLRMEFFERIRTDSIKKIDILIIIHENRELRYLYDILYGNFDIFNLDISLVEAQENLKEFLKKITNKNFDNAFYGIQDSYIISIEELFYLLKYLGKDNCNLSKLFVSWNPFYKGPLVGNFLSDDVLHKKVDIKTMSLRDLLGRIYIKELENDYDNRILVIPQNINELTKNIHTVIENKIGIYVSNLSMAITINDFLRINVEHNIKYLFINENIYNELIQNNYTINAKVIIVPNDVKYCELSSYLDRELKKDKTKTLVK